MNYHTKDNTGSIFKNDRREKDSQPNAKGKAFIGGVWYWVSAWTNEPRRGGDKYQSLAFEEMTPEQVQKYGGLTDPPAKAPATGQRQFANARGPSQRPAANDPVGNDQVFDPEDIPFRWEGRSTTPL